MPAVLPLDVRTEDGRTYQFSRPFLIGRDPACDVCIDNGRVSRRHVLVALENGRWHVHDQQSGNGVLVDGRRVQTAAIGRALTIRLGLDGPSVTLDVASPARDPAEPGAYVPRPDGQPSSRTIFFQRTIKRQRRTYGVVGAVLVLVAAAAAAYAYIAHQRVVVLEAKAEEFFYLMKAQEIKDAKTETDQQLLDQSADEIRDYRRRRALVEREYDEYLAKANYGQNLSREDLVILRVTRRLGECDVAAPPDYLSQVRRFIKQWQSTKRFETAVNLARTKGYTKKIVEELDRFHLPRQFFYMAMQESSFNERAVGPRTRLGLFAKGMWQFIPGTGRTYGLRIGPLERYNQFDPDDDRHDFEKSTHAAARYIKTLYATEAQASALLVMASYNWGENRVVKRIRNMPPDPRERNFWKLLAKYPDDVPTETYNYVMMIVSAAVIGEDPTLFRLSPPGNPLDF